MRPSSTGTVHRSTGADSTLERVPIYEYACMECESHFEELVRSSEQAVTCPECGAAKVLKQLSTFAVHGAAKLGVAGLSSARRRRLLRRLLRLRS